MASRRRSSQTTKIGRRSSILSRSFRTHTPPQTISAILRPAAALSRLVQAAAAAAQLQISTTSDTSSSRYYHAQSWPYVMAKKHTGSRLVQLPSAGSGSSSSSNNSSNNSRHQHQQTAAPAAAAPAVATEPAAATATEHKKKTRWLRCCGPKTHSFVPTLPAYRYA